MTDRPRPSFRHHPAKGTAFQKVGMPFTVTTAKESICREGIAPSGLRAGSLAHAAHTLSPSWGQCFLLGIASVSVWSPTLRDFLFESANTFLTRWNCHAWD